MNLIHKEECVPSSWSEERVQLIHKSKTKTSLDNYRGIAIDSNVGKLFASVWAERLEKVVKETKMLGEMQGGFRRKRCTVDNTFILLIMIQRAQK